jgi:hypothetical protein
LSRRIDVVSCGNAVRKEGRKEREKELMWVAECKRQGGGGGGGGCRVELHTHNGCGLGVSRFSDFVYNAKG